MLAVIGFQLLLATAVIYALWRGGAPEQIVAAGLAVGAAATVLAHFIWETRFREVQLEILLIDTLFLIFMARVAFLANRRWCLWATAAHSTTIAVHLAKLASPGLDWPVYALFSQGSGLPVVVLLWIGTLRHRRRLRLYGTDRPWRRS